MTGYVSRARWPSCWLAILSLTLVLVGCEARPSINSPGPQPPAPTTPQRPAATTPQQPAATTPQQPAATTPQQPAATTPQQHAVALELGGPSIGLPGLLTHEESFGEVTVGAVSAPQVFELRNPREYAVQVVELRLGGDDGFHLTQDRCTQATIPGSGVCTFAVVFGPSQEGEGTAGLHVRLSHVCTSNTYAPCSWDPEYGADMGKNFSRIGLPSGRVAFVWYVDLPVRLVGQGTEAAPTTS